MPQSFNITAKLQLQAGNFQPVIASLQQQLGGFTANINAGISPASTRGVAAMAANIQNLQANLAQTQATASSLNQTLSRGTGAVTATGGFKSLGAQLKATKASIVDLEGNINGASSEMFKFGQQAAVSGRRFAAFTIGALAFVKIASAIREAASEAVEFQRNMVRISQLGAVTNSEITGISEAITKLSTDLGVSSKELANTTIVLKGAGLSIDEVRSALTALAKTSLSPTFKDIKSTAEGLLSLRAQFKLTGKDYESVLGSISGVAREFASESEDIIEAVRRSGAAFKAAAGDFQDPKQSLNEFISLFNSVRATTRESAESIATSLKTIFARLQSNTVIKNLKEMGINLRFTREEAVEAGRDIEGQFLGGQKAIERIQKSLKGISTADPRFAAVVQQVGGTRQVSKVVPLLTEAPLQKKGYAAAVSGANSLERDTAKAQEAFANRLDKIKEQFTGLVREISQSKQFGAAADFFFKFASAAVSLASALKPLIPLLAYLATLKLGSSILQFGKGFLNAPKVGGGRYASGGVVGSGSGASHSDSMSGHLPKDSFVIRSPVARKLPTHFVRQLTGEDGSRNHKMMPVAVMPGEIIVPPGTARRHGRALHALNKGYTRFAGGGFTSGVPHPYKDYFDNAGFSDVNYGSAINQFRILKKVQIKEGKKFGRASGTFSPRTGIVRVGQNNFEEMLETAAHEVLGHGLDWKVGMEDSGFRGMFASDIEGHPFNRVAKETLPMFKKSGLTSGYKHEDYLGEGLANAVGKYVAVRKVTGSHEKIMEHPHVLQHKVVAQAFDAIHNLYLPAAREIIPHLAFGGFASRAIRLGASVGSSKTTQSHRQNVFTAFDKKHFASGGSLSSHVDSIHQVGNKFDKFDFLRMAEGPHGLAIASHLVQGAKFLGHGRDAAAFKVSENEAIRIGGIGRDGISANSRMRPIHSMILQATERHEHGPYVVEKLPLVPALAGKNYSYSRQEKIKDAFKKRLVSQGKIPTDVIMQNLGRHNKRVVAIDPDVFREPRDAKELKNAQDYHHIGISNPYPEIASLTNSWFPKMASGGYVGDSPLPIDLDLKNYAKSANLNADRSRRHSLDLAKRHWYAEHRSVRFGKAFQKEELTSKHLPLMEMREARYKLRKGLAGGGFVDKFHKLKSQITGHPISQAVGRELSHSNTFQAYMNSDVGYALPTSQILAMGASELALKHGMKLVNKRRKGLAVGGNVGLPENIQRILEASFGKKIDFGNLADFSVQDKLRGHPRKAEGLFRPYGEEGPEVNVLDPRNKTNIAHEYGHAADFAVARHGGFDEAYASNVPGHPHNVLANAALHLVDTERYTKSALARGKDPKEVIEREAFTEAMRITKGRPKHISQLIKESVLPGIEAASRQPRKAYGPPSFKDLSYGVKRSGQRTGDKVQAETGYVSPETVSPVVAPTNPEVKPSSMFNEYRPGNIPGYIQVKHPTSGKFFHVREHLKGNDQGIGLYHAISSEPLDYGKGRENIEHAMRSTPGLEHLAGPAPEGEVPMKNPKFFTNFQPTEYDINKKLGRRAKSQGRQTSDDIPSATGENVIRDYADPRALSAHDILTNAPSDREAEIRQKILDLKSQGKTVPQMEAELKKTGDISNIEHEDAVALRLKKVAKTKAAKLTGNDRPDIRAIAGTENIPSVRSFLGQHYPQSLANVKTGKPLPAKFTELARDAKRAIHTVSYKYSKVGKSEDYLRGRHGAISGILAQHGYQLGTPNFGEGSVTSTVERNTSDLPVPAIVPQVASEPPRPQSRPSPLGELTKNSQLQLTDQRRKTSRGTPVSPSIGTTFPLPGPVVATPPDPSLAERIHEAARTGIPISIPHKGKAKEALREHRAVAEQLGYTHKVTQTTGGDPYQFSAKKESEEELFKAYQGAGGKHASIKDIEDRLDIPGPTPGVYGLNTRRKSGELTGTTPEKEALFKAIGRRKGVNVKVIGGSGGRLKTAAHYDPEDNEGYAEQFKTGSKPGRPLGSKNRTQVVGGAVVPAVGTEPKVKTKASSSGGNDCCHGLLDILRAILDAIKSGSNVTSKAEASDVADKKKKTKKVKAEKEAAPVAIGDTGEYELGTRVADKSVKHPSPNIHGSYPLLGDNYHETGTYDTGYDRFHIQGHYSHHGPLPVNPNPEIPLGGPPDIHPIGVDEDTYKVHALGRGTRHQLTSEQEEAIRRHPTTHGAAEDLFGGMINRHNIPAHEDPNLIISDQNAQIGEGDRHIFNRATGRVENPGGGTNNYKSRSTRNTESRNQRASELRTQRTRNPRFNANDFVTSAGFESPISTAGPLTHDDVDRESRERLVKLAKHNVDYVPYKAQKFDKQAGHQVSSFKELSSRFGNTTDKTSEAGQEARLRKADLIRQVRSASEGNQTLARRAISGGADVITSRDGQVKYLKDLATENETKRIEKVRAGDFPTFKKLFTRKPKEIVPPIDPLDAVTGSSGPPAKPPGLFGKIKGKFGKFGGLAGGAIAAATQFAPQFAESITGTVANPTHNIADVKAGRIISGGLSGAGQGAAIGGLAGGPIGAAVGGVIGALHGFITSANEVDKEIREVKIGKSLANLDKVLEDVGSGRIKATDAASSLSRDLGTFDKTESEHNVTNTQFQDNAIGRFVHSIVGASGTVGIGERIEGRKKYVQENLAPRVGQFRSFNQQLASDIKIGPESLATKNAEGKDLSAAELEVNSKKRLAAFDAAGGATIANKVVEATPGLTHEKYYKELDRDIVESNKLRLANIALTKTVNQQDLEFQKFSRIASAIDATVSSMEGLQHGLDATEAAFGGTLQAIGGKSQLSAVENVGGLDDAAHAKGVSFITQSLKSGLQGNGPFEHIKSLASGGPAGSLVDNLGEAAIHTNKLRSALPDIINRAAEGGIEGEGLKKRILSGIEEHGKPGINPSTEKSDIPDVIRDKVSNLLDSMKLEDLGKNASENVQKLVDDLMKEGFANVNDVMNKAAKELADNANNFNAGLIKNQEMINKIGESEDRYANLQVKSAQSSARVQAEIVGRPGQADLSIETQFAPYQKRQERLSGLTGVDANNPELIGKNLQKLRGDITKKTLDRDTAPNQKVANAAAIELANLQGNAQRLGQALEHLADPVEKNAILQEKLNRIEADRDSKLSFTERLSTASPQELFDIHKNAHFSDIAVQQGSLAGLHPEIAKGALEHLSSLGEASLPGYGGRKASDVRKQLVVNTALQGGTLTQSGEKERLGVINSQAENDKKAVEAQKEIVIDQKTLQVDFFAKLEGIQSAFFGNLAVHFAEAAKKDITAQVGENQGQLNKVRSAEKAQNFFAAEGLTIEQAKAAKSGGLDRLQELGKQGQEEGVNSRFASAHEAIIKGHGTLGELASTINSGSSPADKDKAEIALASELSKQLGSGTTPEEISGTVIPKYHETIDKEFAKGKVDPVKGRQILATVVAQHREATKTRIGTEFQTQLNETNQAVSGGNPQIRESLSNLATRYTPKTLDENYKGLGEFSNQDLAFQGGKARKTQAELAVLKPKADAELTASIAERDRLKQVAEANKVAATAPKGIPQPQTEVTLAQEQRVGPQDVIIKAAKPVVHSQLERNRLRNTPIQQYDNEGRELPMGAGGPALQQHMMQEVPRLNMSGYDVSISGVKQGNRRTKPPRPTLIPKTIDTGEFRRVTKTGKIVGNRVGGEGSKEYSRAFSEDLNTYSQEQITGFQNQANIHIPVSPPPQKTSVPEGGNVPGSPQPSVGFTEYEKTRAKELQRAKNNSGNVRLSNSIKDKVIAEDKRQGYNQQPVSPPQGQEQGQVLQKGADPMIAFSQNIQALGGIVGGFDKTISTMGATLSGLAAVFKDLKIPDKIIVERDGKIDVVINGGQLLAAITGDVAKLVQGDVLAAVMTQLPKIVKDMPATA
jgi:hypothetical protein